jgi:ribosomal protein S18 acetylase RimI-like enzyme
MSFFKKKLNITFKKVTTDDVDEFLHIEKSTIDSKIYSRISDEQEAIEEIKNNEVYFIVKDGEIIGSLAYQIQGPGHAYLSGLVVLPEFQGQGIAREAVKFRLDKLKDMKKIDFVTHPHNSKVIMLYLSLGFHIESWKDNYWGDDEPRIVLAREQ